MDDTIDSWAARWLAGRLLPQPGIAGAPLPARTLSVRRHPGDEHAASLADEELALRFRRGDEQAFERLYARYRAPVLRYVRRTTVNSADVEELVQEIWLAVIRGRERGPAHARFVTYLFCIARRRCIDRWRRHGARVQAGPDESPLEALAAPVHTGPHPRAENEAMGAAIAGAIDALPLPQRETFLLRAETDLTLEEIAQVTGTTRETAKSRLRYAFNRLRVVLEPWHE